MRLFLCLVAIGCDYFLAPALYNGSTLWATAALTLLIFRRGQAATAGSAEAAIARLSAVRITVFVALHVGIVISGHYFSYALASAAASDAFAAASFAAAKLLILLPVVVLFSWEDWPGLLRKYRAEFVGAFVVLFTFFPYRLFHTVWPTYSHVIAKLSFYGAKPFVAGLVFLNQPIPEIVGPKIDLAIVFWCSGFSALAIFDVLVALIAFLDWNDLDPKRVFVVYIAGCLAILVANVVRITLLVLVGNLLDPKYAIGRFHVNAGWVFFALVYLAIFSASYRWMLRR
jgi:exosortase/archaeosortase family protein